MKSVLVTGVNKDMAKLFALDLSKKINFNFVDAELEFQNILINEFDETASLLDDELDKKEKKFLKKISKLKNSVIYVADDTFISNQNYDIFIDFNTVVLEIETKSKILGNIQKLIKEKCKFCIK